MSWRNQLQNNVINWKTLYFDKENTIFDTFTGLNREPEEPAVFPKVPFSKIETRSKKTTKPVTKYISKSNLGNKIHFGKQHKTENKKILKQTKIITKRKHCNYPNAVREREGWSFYNSNGNRRQMEQIERNKNNESVEGEKKEKPTKMYGENRKEWGKKNMKATNDEITSTKPTKEGAMKRLTTKKKKQPNEENYDDNAEGAMKRLLIRYDEDVMPEQANKKYGNTIMKEKKQYDDLDYHRTITTQPEINEYFKKIEDVGSRDSGYYTRSQPSTLSINSHCGVMVDNIQLRDVPELQGSRSVEDDTGLGREVVVEENPGSNREDTPHLLIVAHATTTEAHVEPITIWDTTSNSNLGTASAFNTEDNNRVAQNYRNNQLFPYKKSNDTLLNKNGWNKGRTITNMMGSFKFLGKFKFTNYHKVPTMLHNITYDRVWTRPTRLPSTSSMHATSGRSIGSMVSSSTFAWIQTYYQNVPKT